MIKNIAVPLLVSPKNDEVPNLTYTTSNGTFFMPIHGNTSPYLITLSTNSKLNCTATRRAEMPRFRMKGDSYVSGGLTGLTTLHPADENKSMQKGNRYAAWRGLSIAGPSDRAKPEIR